MLNVVDWDHKNGKRSDNTESNCQALCPNCHAINVFHTLDIEAAICTRQEGREMMDWPTSTMVGRSMGIDVAWGDTSKFAIVITQHRNRKVEVFYAESFEKPQMNEINHIMQLKQRHHCTRLSVDGVQAHSAYLNTIKQLTLLPLEKVLPAIRIHKPLF